MPYFSCEISPGDSNVFRYKKDAVRSIFDQKRKIGQEMSAYIKVNKKGLSSHRCPYCHENVDKKEFIEVCAACKAIHHQECWSEHGCCSTCSKNKTLSKLPTQEDLAYKIWVNAGKPEGQAEKNWHQACTQLNELKRQGHRATNGNDKIKYSSKAIIPLAIAIILLPIAMLAGGLLYMVAPYPTLCIVSIMFFIAYLHNLLFLNGG